MTIGYAYLVRKCGLLSYYDVTSFILNECEGQLSRFRSKNLSYMERAWVFINRPSIFNLGSTFPVKQVHSFYAVRESIYPGSLLAWCYSSGPVGVSGNRRRVRSTALRLRSWVTGPILYESGSVESCVTIGHANGVDLASGARSYLFARDPLSRNTA